MFGNMTTSARRDLIVIAIVAVVAFIFELVTHMFEYVILFFERIEANGFPFDFGELVMMPLVLAISFLVFSYRRNKELQAVIAARQRAQQAAQAQQQQIAQVQRDAEQARQQAEELERLNRQLIDTGMNALVKVDREGMITETNEGMEVATGLHSSRLVGTSVFSFFGDQKQARDWFDRSLDGSAVQNEKAELVHQDGGTT